MTRMVFRMRLHISWVLLTYLYALHGLMVVTVMLTSIPWFLRIALLLVCLLSLRFYHQQYYQQTGRHKLVKIERDNLGLWHLFYGDQGEYTALSLSRCLVMPELVILYFDGQRYRQKRAVWITADTVDSELFRQLRVYCRDPKTAQQ